MFKKAQRKTAKIKIALTGPSGSGKTYSSLVLAKRLGKKVAFIDTENGSASLYSDRFNFYVVDLTPPYTTDKYIEAIDCAIKEGYDCLVIDSLTHAWAGEGGILDRKTQIDQRGGNSFTNWGKFTPEQDKFTAKILNAPVHIISTMRSKQEYIISENNKGKATPQKVGLAPVQRDGVEYEFTIVFDIAMNHEAATSKDRTGLFTDKIFKITENTGELILNWLEGGVDVTASLLSKIRESLETVKDSNYVKTVTDYIERPENQTEKVLESCLEKIRLKKGEIHA